MSKKISFHFQPNLQKSGIYAGTMLVEKEENGKKRRYLEGVSSGLKEDAHKERVSENCINKFMEQANSGDILLYADVHGISQSDDIGILAKAEIIDNGDWFTSYRLYDEDDEVGQYKLEKINNIWKQSIGAPPYKKPKQKGFSIEGIIPEGGVLSSAKGGTPILDDIELDGVVLVPRPAYMDSVANAVYKALEVLPPWREEKVQKNIQGKLNEIINEKEVRNQYWKKKYDIQDALEQVAEEIMHDPKDMKIERLNIVFDEYKSAMVNLLMESQDIFQEDDLNQEVMRSIDAGKNKSQVYKAIALEMGKLQKYLARRI